MNDSYLLIRFGELSTKGANKNRFVSCLGRNIRHALKEFQVEVISDRDHIYVSYLPEQFEAVTKRLQEISGIQRISLVHILPKEIQPLKEAALKLLLEEGGKTFRTGAIDSACGFYLTGETHSYDQKTVLGSVTVVEFIKHIHFIVQFRIERSGIRAIV